MLRVGHHVCGPDGGIAKGSDCMYTRLTHALAGRYGFALALWLFSGLLLTSTLVLLFGLLAYQRWFAAGPSPSRHPSPPSLRSSPSHR